MQQTKLTYEEILSALRAIIGDNLGVDESDVVPEASFFDDLGGESIDQLDLSFQCERAFGVKHPFQPIAELPSLLTESNGRLTPEIVDDVSRKFPFLRSTLESLGGRVDVRDLKRVFTVGLIARLIEFADGRATPK